VSKEELEKLLKNGLSTRLIALSCSLSQSRISQLLKEYNLKPNFKFNRVGGKRLYSVVTIESNKKRSETLKGKFFLRKKGDYKPAEIRRCGACGKEIKVKGNNRRKQHISYCSRRCMSFAFMGRKPANFKGGPQQVRCTECKKEIMRSITEALRYKRHFCSQKCAGLWKSKNLVGGMIYNWKGGYEPYYGPNWVRQRKLCRERDHNTCRKCSKTAQQLGKNLDVDHKIPFEAFNGNYEKANDLINLWSLCPSCHSQKTNWQTKQCKLTLEQWAHLIKRWYPS